MLKTKSFLPLGIALILLLCCTMSATAQEENQVRTCEPYTLSLAGAQGFQETDAQGNILKERIVLNNLDLGASESYTEDFLVEISDYALAMGLPMIASCSQKTFKEQMGSGVVEVDNYSPDDGFLNERNLRVGYFGGKYCIAVRENSLGTKKVDIIPVALEDMKQWDNANEAVAQAQYFGYGYDEVTVDQTDVNRQKVVEAAEKVINTKDEWEGDKDNYYYLTLLKRSKAKMDVSYDSQPIIGSSESMEDDE